MGARDCRPLQNLSVPARNLITMDIPSHTPDRAPGSDDSFTHFAGTVGRRAGETVFADPVAYLASLGIDSELIEIDALPAAA
jgi:hypothetical protein